MFALERQPCSVPKVLNPITRIPIEFDSRRKMSFYSRGNAMCNNTLPTPVALRVWTSSSSSSFLTCFSSSLFTPLADCVYIESRRPNTPYFICSIQDFKLVSTFFFPLLPATLPTALFFGVSFMGRSVAYMCLVVRIFLEPRIGIEGEFHINHGKTQLYTQFMFCGLFFQLHGKIKLPARLGLGY